MIVSSPKLFQWQPAAKCLACSITDITKFKHSDKDQGCTSTHVIYLSLGFTTQYKFNKVGKTTIYLKTVVHWQQFSLHPYPRKILGIGRLQVSAGLPLQSAWFWPLGLCTVVVVCARRREGGFWAVARPSHSPIPQSAGAFGWSGCFVV